MCLGVHTCPLLQVVHKLLTSVLFSANLQKSLGSVAVLMQVGPMWKAVQSSTSTVSSSTQVKPMAMFGSVSKSDAPPTFAGEDEVHTMYS